MRPVRVGCSGWNYDDWRGRLYPEGWGQPRWLRALRGGVRHGGGQLDLLPAAHRAAVARWAEQTPARLRVRGQGQPLPHPHPPPARPGRRAWSCSSSAIEPLRRPAEARTRGVAAAAELPPRRRAAGGGARRACRRAGTASSSATRAGSRSPCTSCCASTSAALVIGDHPQLAVPGARAHRGLDARPPPPRRAAGGAATTRPPRSRSGRGASRVAPASRGVRLLQQRLGGLRRGERAPAQAASAASSRRLRRAAQQP